KGRNAAVDSARAALHRIRSNGCGLLKVRPVGEAHAPLRWQPVHAGRNGQVDEGGPGGVQSGNGEGVTKQLCGIKCPGADRDSVISKTPMWNHKCVRFSTYDTLERNQEWFIWRSGACLQQNITLEVHCGFPEKQRK
ncbi:hypothetical protein PRIPAC_81100, partial [Pristionchus pacificus]